MAEREYVKPAVMDFGTLISLTEATAIGGLEDGASKNDPPGNHHSFPLAP